MSELQVNVQGSSNNATQFVSKARNFTLTVDEPADLDGTDQGANPIEFLLSAYAGCLNVVGHLVAEEIGFQLDKINIEVSGSLNPDRLFGQSDEKRAGLQYITVNLNPESDATPEQLYQWLAEVENRCPVNDNLRNPTPVKVNVNKSLTQKN